MYDEELKEHLKKKLKKVEKENDHRLIKTIEREWVEHSTYLTVLNFLYYRYFTNRFLLYVIKKSNTKL